MHQFMELEFEDAEGRYTYISFGKYMMTMGTLDKQTNEVRTVLNRQQAVKLRDTLNKYLEYSDGEAQCSK